MLRQTPAVHAGGVTHPVRTAMSVAAGVSGTAVYEVTQDQTLVSARVRLYAGNQLSMQVTLGVIRSDTFMPIVQDAVGSKSYIDGDNEDILLHCDWKVYAGDQLAVMYNNIDPTYTYDFAVTWQLVGRS